MGPMALELRELRDRRLSLTLKLVWRCRDSSKAYIGECHE